MLRDESFSAWVIFCSAIAFCAESSCSSLYRFGSLVSGCWVGSHVNIARQVSLELSFFLLMLSIPAKTPKEFCLSNKRLNNDQVSAQFTEEGKNAR